IYAPGGALSCEHLLRGAAIELDGDPAGAAQALDEQYRFKQRCYDLAVGRLGDHIYGGVPPHDLAAIENHQLLRADSAPHLAAMLAALRADLAAGIAITNARGDAVPAPPHGGITIGSAYRSPEQDRDLWDQCFQRCVVETLAYRTRL